MSTDGLIPVPEDLDLGSTIRGFAEGQRLFDRYTLKNMLGRGGIGVVWLASDEKLERWVALKFLPEIVKLDSSALDELKHETRRSLELPHPNIVRIHDFVDDPTMAAISMEFVNERRSRRCGCSSPRGCCSRARSRNGYGSFARRCSSRTAR